MKTTTENHKESVEFVLVVIVFLPSKNDKKQLFLKFVRDTGRVLFNFVQNTYFSLFWW